MANFSDQHNQPLASDEALQAHIEQALAASPMVGRELDVLYAVIKRAFKPQVFGVEKIPDRPCLFVGNHSLFALDAFVMGPLMLKEYGRFLRPMGDKFLFTQPGLAKLLLSRGGTMGHPEVCSALMAAGEDVLVFPGGAHEAVKPASKRYELQWKERFGFIKLAASHGYTIVPFGMVGPDEFYTHLIEGSDVPNSAIAPLLRKAGLLGDDTRPDMIPPLPLGVMGTLLPKPQPCYLSFAEPVSLASYKRRKPGKAQLKQIRDEVALRIEDELAELLLIREQSRQKDGLLRRLLTV